MISIRRRGALVVALLFALGLAIAPQNAAAHAALVRANPGPGATLEAPPADIRLTFSERPESSLSEVQVSDFGGASYDSGKTEPVSGDPLSLSVPVQRLGRGTYTVSYRVVSAVDGHSTGGSYSFGVGAAPKGGAAISTTTTQNTSWIEFLARWILIVGLVALLGGAVAGAARFGGSGGTDLKLAAGGWLVSVAGLILLTVAQRKTADSSLGELLDTSVGRALIWRGVAIAVTGAALLVARRSPRIRRGALLGAALATVAAMTVHVAAGHAAAGSWPSALTISAQVAHFAAAGIWFGGLAALLLGVRGSPSAEKAAAVRRFSTVALVALLVLLATGTLRAIDELSTVGELVTSGYGRAILAKIVLLGIIVAIAARNRRSSVPAADSDLAPLRRRSRAELALAFVALGAAALLGTLAPPAPVQTASAAAAATGLSDSGSDFATSVKVELTAAATKPGPNRFRVRVEDYDSGEPVDAHVSLRFTPLDDPGIAPTTLALAARADGTYTGSGANLAFDGRWGVSVLVQRGASAVEVPLELDIPPPKYFVSVIRAGEHSKYTMLVGGIGYIRIAPDPERAGPSTVHVGVYTSFQAFSDVEQLVVTAGPRGGPIRQQPVRQVGEGRFDARVDLESGPFTITVIARTADGTRLLGAFDLTIP